MIIDTHAHLMFDQFKGEVPAVLKRASDVGVGKVVNVGCSVESSKRAWEMIDEFGGGVGALSVGAGGSSSVSLYATLGLHPYDVLDLTDGLLDEWEEWIRGDQGCAGGGSVGRRIVAIGEIGLDYFKATKVSHEDQKTGFRRQLEFALRVGLPVVIHNREADEDTFEILREYPDVKAVFHCYGSSLEFARKLWDYGYYTSFTGVITYPGASGLRDVVREAPDWTIMVETDCPFLAPQSVQGECVRGERNEPAYVVEVLREVARVRRKGIGEVEELQERNVGEFYGV